MGVASLFSVSIGAANTLIIVLSATFYRDILRRYKSNDDEELKYSRIITFFVALIGIIFSIALPNIVQLMINAFFGISILFPPLFYGIFSNRKLNSFAGIISLAIGFILVIIFLPILGNQAFVPGLIGSTLGIFIGKKIKKRESINVS